MEIIVRPRRAGKTHQIVEWVKEGERQERWPYWTRILITYSLQEEVRVRNQFNLDPHQIIAAAAWQQRYRYGRAGSVEIAIDNVDLILQALFGPDPIKVVTINGD